ARREAVFDARGDRRMRVPMHEAVGVERAQRLGEHLLADALDDAAQFAPPARALAERGEDEHAPLARDVVEHGSGWTLGGQDAVREPGERDAESGGPGTYVHATSLPKSGYSGLGSKFVVDGFDPSIPSLQNKGIP